MGRPAAPTFDNYYDYDDDDDDDNYGDYGDEDDNMLMMIIYRLYTASNQCHKKSHIYIHGGPAEPSLHNYDCVRFILIINSSGIFSQN